MSRPRSLVVPLCAAFCAALLGHVAIDVLGDYLLPHDAYDDVAHVSRDLLAGVVAALVAVVIGTAVRAALREARGCEAAFCRALAALAPRRAFVLYAIVVTATFAAVAAMEALDCAIAGSRIDDLGDLFGGSLWLGGSTSLVAALVSAALARRLLRRLVSLRAAVVAWFALILLGRLRATRPPAARRPTARVVHRGFTAVRRFAGRAPPFLPIA